MPAAFSRTYTTGTRQTAAHFRGIAASGPALRQAHERAARLVYDAAHRLTPVGESRPGHTHMRDALFYRPSGGLSRLTVTIGYDLLKAPHAKAVELGRPAVTIRTKPPGRRARKGNRPGALRWEIAGRPVFATEVEQDPRPGRFTLKRVAAETRRQVSATMEAAVRRAARG